MLPLFGRGLPSEIQGKKSWVTHTLEASNFNYSYRNCEEEEEEEGIITHFFENLH